jgi:GNAT superfamily N-acetyltransferase
MTPLQLRYKVARYIDAAEVTEICKMFHAESWQRFAKFDFDKMQQWIEERIDMDDSDIFTAWDNDLLVGCLVGMAYYYPYSKTLVAGDYIWYVIPEYRGGMIGVRLMKMFEEWARGVGAANICTGATSGINSERGALLLQRLGYSPVGLSMQKDLI